MSASATTASFQKSARFLKPGVPPRTRGFLGAFNRRFDAAQGRYVSVLGRIPKAGDSAVYNGLRFTVLAIDGFAVKRVRVERAG